MITMLKNKYKKSIQYLMKPHYLKILEVSNKKAHYNEYHMDLLIIKLIKTY